MTPSGHDNHLLTAARRCAVAYTQSFMIRVVPFTLVDVATSKSNVLVLVLVLVHIGNATACSGRGVYTRRRTHCAKIVLYLIGLYRMA